MTAGPEKAVTILAQMPARVREKVQTIVAFHSPTGVEIYRAIRKALAEDDGEEDRPFNDWHPDPPLGR